MKFAALNRSFVEPFLARIVSFSALESRSCPPLGGHVSRPSVLTVQRRRRYSRPQRFLLVTDVLYSLDQRLHHLRSRAFPLTVVQVEGLSTVFLLPRHRADAGSFLLITHSTGEACFSALQNLISSWSIKHVTLDSLLTPRMWSTRTQAAVFNRVPSLYVFEVTFSFASANDARADLLCPLLFTGEEVPNVSRPCPRASAVLIILLVNTRGLQLTVTITA